MPSNTLEIQVDQLELGRLYYKACDLDIALASLETALQDAELAGDDERWARLIPLLLRVHAERLNFPELERLQAKVREAETSGRLTATSSIEYVKGISVLYGGQMDAADTLFTRALELARDRKERAQAAFGRAAVLSRRGDFTGALARLETLRAEIDGVESLSDHAIAARQLEAVCLRESGQTARAAEVLSEAETLCRLDQNLFLLVNSLFLRGTVAQKDGDTDKAAELYDLCETLLREKDLKHLKMQLDQRRQQLRETVARPVVRVVTGARTVVHSPDAGAKDCTGQVILLKLLDFLAGGQRSKEEIVRHLWAEDYHPLRHDNKVYVTIRRLRQVLEKNINSPRILLKKSEGYLLNPDYRYLVERKTA